MDSMAGGIRVEEFEEFEGFGFSGRGGDCTTKVCEERVGKKRNGEG